MSQPPEPIEQQTSDIKTAKSLELIRSVQCVNILIISSGRYHDIIIYTRVKPLISVTIFHVFESSTCYSKNIAHRRIIHPQINQNMILRLQYAILNTCLVKSVSLKIVGDRPLNSLLTHPKAFYPSRPLTS
jgi:hypothetical protein